MNSFWGLSFFWRHGYLERDFNMCIYIYIYNGEVAESQKANLINWLEQNDFVQWWRAVGGNNTEEEECVAAALSLDDCFWSIDKG